MELSQGAGPWLQLSMWMPVGNPVTPRAPNPAPLSILVMSAGSSDMMCPSLLIILGRHWPFL
jgi:hypothetical protein